MNFSRAYRRGFAVTMTSHKDGKATRLAFSDRPIYLDNQATTPTDPR